MKAASNKVQPAWVMRTFAALLRLMKTVGRQLLPANDLTLRNALNLWLILFGIMVAISATQSLNSTPRLELKFTRPVAVLDVASLLHALPRALREKLLTTIGKDQQLSQMMNSLTGPGPASISYFDDNNTRDDSGYIYGKPQSKPVADRVRDLEMRLKTSGNGFFQSLVINGGDPRFAFHEAADSITRESGYPPELPDPDMVCCHNPTPLYDAAANYFLFSGLPKNVVTNHSKRFVEEKLIESLDEEEKLMALNAILEHKHILRGVQVANLEDYPVSGAVLQVEAFPVPTAVAGPMTDGVMSTGTLSPRTARCALATLYPVSQDRRGGEYYMLHSWGDGIHKSSFSVSAPPFQSAAQLVKTSPANVATVLTIFYVIAWCLVKRMAPPL